MFSKYSRIDIEGIVNSSGYTSFESAINDRIDNTKERLITAKDIDQVKDYQAEIKAYRYLLKELSTHKRR